MCKRFFGQRIWFDTKCSFRLFRISLIQHQQNFLARRDSNLQIKMQSSIKTTYDKGDHKIICLILNIHWRLCKIRLRPLYASLSNFNIFESRPIMLSINLCFASYFNFYQWGLNFWMDKHVAPCTFCRFCRFCRFLRMTHRNCKSILLNYIIFLK